jgi:hypothetical protein
MVNIQDKLIDQIVAELEEIVQCYWRMKACCDALPPDKHNELNEKFFDVFLANTTRKHGQPFLTQIRTMVLSWRSKKPTSKKIPARTLSSVALTRKMERMRHADASKSLVHTITTHRYSKYSELGHQLRVCSACNDSPSGRCRQHMITVEQKREYVSCDHVYDCNCNGPRKRNYKGK